MEKNKKRDARVVKLLWRRARSGKSLKDWARGQAEVVRDPGLGPLCREWLSRKGRA